jgi:AGCS family alanine or glycine:cation symporter
VALLEPFIDTIIICTMTGLVIITTGVWNEKVPTPLPLDDVNITYVQVDEQGAQDPVGTPESLIIDESYAQAVDRSRLAYYDVSVDTLYTDPALTQPFAGTLYPAERRAVDAAGNTYTTLYGRAVRSSSPLTTLGFERGLEQIGLGGLGRFIVLISVFLFALSTSISWSYYGDRCANYIWGTRAILPYKMVFVLMHFIGATLAVTTIWDLGDTALSLVTLPNVLSLVLLSGLVKKLTDSYFERKPWIENADAHRRAVEARRQKRDPSVKP